MLTIVVMRPVEFFNFNCICVADDSGDDGGGMPTIQLVIVPLHVTFISGNTIVLVTDIILVIL